MPDSMYDQLLSKLPEIAEAIRVFEHGNVQERVVDEMIRALRNQCERSTPGESSSGSHDEGDTDSADSGRSAQGLHRIATALGISGDRIEEIYVEDGDALQIAADPGSLGSSTQSRAAAVALLVAGGRQLGGWDPAATADVHIRAEIDRLGLYDQANYARHMKGTTSWLNINGSGKSATFKLKFPGRQHLKELAQQFTSGR